MTSGTCMMTCRK